MTMRKQWLEDSKSWILIQYWLQIALRTPCEQKSMKIAIISKGQKRLQRVNCLTRCQLESVESCVKKWIHRLLVVISYCRRISVEIVHCCRNFIFYKWTIERVIHVQPIYAQHSNMGAKYHVYSICFDWSCLVSNWFPIQAVHRMRAQNGNYIDSVKIVFIRKQ